MSDQRKAKRITISLADRSRPKHDRTYRLTTRQTPEKLFARILREANG